MRKVPRRGFIRGHGWRLRGGWFRPMWWLWDGGCVWWGVVVGARAVSGVPVVGLGKVDVERSVRVGSRGGPWGEAEVVGEMGREALGSMNPLVGFIF